MRSKRATTATCNTEKSEQLNKEKILVKLVKKTGKKI